MRFQFFAATLAALATIAVGHPALAFCGFYVAKADASLFNQASQVILTRDGKRTVITMLNDYQGDPSEFALVVPVPVVLGKDDVRIAEKRIFERLDAYSTPRLVEYFDPDPCAKRPELLMFLEQRMRLDNLKSIQRVSSEERTRTLGVTIENSFAVGEYEILILSAKQSDGLETWLGENGYRLPAGASAALRPYVRQDMKFFVAKVNLAEHAAGASRMLRPIQFSFASDRFMLPLRLGMLNAKGPQDLIIYALSQRGRIEATNYQTVELPTNEELPIVLQDPQAFRTFYARMFGKVADTHGLKAVFTEYVWDMGWCDPCASMPLSNDELVAAGADWVVPKRNIPTTNADGTILLRAIMQNSGTVLTRLHLRYTPATFPEDLVLQETADRRNFQARYVLRHAYPTTASACPMAPGYLDSVVARQGDEVRALERLSGLTIDSLKAQAVR